MSKGRVNRRDFIAGAAAVAGAGALAKGRRALSAPRAQGEVFSAFHENMLTGSTPDTVQPEWVRAGLDACLIAMTGQADSSLAWQAAFPGIAAGSKVAIKVNCLNDNVFPHLATVAGIVGGLTSMFGGGFPAANISLFDNNLWRSGKVDACYGSSELDALGIWHAEDSYDAGQTVQVGGTTMYISRAWAESDFGISLAKMAPHQYYAGGLSGVIKNMMGALSLQANSTYEAKRNSIGFHDVAPYTAWRDFYANYAAAHLHLYIVDMLFACRHENESGWDSVVKRISLGDDPCAVDAYNVDLINDLGMNVAMPVTKAVPEALEAAGIGTTAYSLTEPEVTVGQRPPNRDELDALIRDRRAGLVSDQDVQSEIKRYREQ